MITGLLHLHSSMRYVVLALLIFTFIRAVKNRKNSDFKAQAKLGLFTMISMHIQLVLGLALFLNGHWAEYTVEGLKRFIMMEHTPMMIIAIILGTLGHSLAKLTEVVATKFKRQIIFFGISLFIIFGMIPWPFMRNFDLVYGWI